MNIDLTIAPPSAEEIKAKIAECTSISKSLRKTLWIQTAGLVGINLLTSLILLTVFGSEYLTGLAIMFVATAAFIILDDIETNEDFGLRVAITLVLYLAILVPAYFHQKGIDHSQIPYFVAAIVHVASYFPLARYLGRTRNKKHDTGKQLKEMANINNDNCGEILELKSKYSVIDTYITNVQKSGRILVVAEEDAIYAYHKSATEKVSKEKKEVECRELHFGKMLVDE